MLSTKFYFIKQSKKSILASTKSRNMKNIKNTLSLIFMVLMSAGLMWSCSYTNNTSGSKQFAKKHYNRGVVKIKSTKKDKIVTETFAKAEDKVTRKEKKEAIKEEVKAFIDGESFTATNEEGAPEYTPEAMEEMLSAKVVATKEKLIAQKESATSDKERKKLDKKINRVDRLEGLTSRIAEKASANYIPPGPEAAVAPASGGGLGLAAGILGIMAFVFAFAPYLAILALPLALAAIIMGAIGINGNRPWAIAGIVLGAITILLFVLLLLIFAAFLF